VKQVDLFAPAVLTPPPPSTCGFHGAEIVCDQCPDGYWTDGLGFPKDKRLTGQTPTRLCSGCLKPCTKLLWVVAKGCCDGCAAKGFDGREGF
jgi:hypothetical protein